MSTSDYKMEIDNPMKEKAIKTAVNDISTDLESVSKDLKSMSDQLPALVATRSEINWLKNQTERFDTRLADAAAVIEKGVTVRVDPAKLSVDDVQMLQDLRSKLGRWNKRWETIWKAIANTGKIKVYLTGIMSSALSVCITLLVCYDSSYIWAHRAFVASEAKHDENPSEEYSKYFSEMKGNWKSRKSTKERIEGLESEAEYVKKLESVIADYTEEELDVKEHKVRIQEEQKAWITCVNPLSGQRINFRIHTTTKGIVTKVDREKKIKGKTIWEELEPLNTQRGDNSNN